MRQRFFFSFSLLLAILAACATPTPTAIPNPPTAASSPLAPTTSSEKIRVVVVTTPSVVNTHPGERAALTLQFKPQFLESGKTASGATFASLTPWDNANLSQMQVCIEFEKECMPSGMWMNFQTEWTIHFDADWLGQRAVWIGTQFRDTNGQLVPVYATSHSSAQNIGAMQITLNSVLDEKTPMTSQPAFAQTAVAATRAAYPVTGSLVLQNGLCCAGGKVGTTIEINAAFEAISPNTSVTQMRLLNHCGTQSEMNTALWEPFVKQKTFSYTIAVANWVGWYLAVQYRDANGNLSPIYCADISVEGMPQ